MGKKKAACAGNWDKVQIRCSVWTVRREVEWRGYRRAVILLSGSLLDQDLPYSYPVHCWDTFPLLEYIKMSQTSWVSLLSRWASCCCTLCKQYCPHKMGSCCTLHAHPNGFRGAPHEIIPKETGACASDTHQLNKCLCTRLQPVLFPSQRTQTSISAQLLWQNK